MSGTAKADESGSDGVRVTSEVNRYFPGFNGFFEASMKAPSNSTSIAVRASINPTDTFIDHSPACLQFPAPDLEARTLPGKWRQYCRPLSFGSLSPRAQQISHINRSKPDLQSTRRCERRQGDVFSGGKGRSSTVPPRKKLQCLSTAPAVCRLLLQVVLSLDRFDESMRSVQHRETKRQSVRNQAR